MLPDNCQPIGKLSKLHGVRGELILQATDPLPKKLDKTERLFLIIDGLPVPFFISDIIIRNDITAIVKFDDINTAEEAEDLIGLEVLFEQKTKSKKKFTVAADDVKGYLVYDINHGDIGKVNSILNYNNNLLLQVFKNKTEILIPVSESTIQAINDKKKTITIECPVGLLELYL